MRFLVDVCATGAVVTWLRAEGHDVAEVRDGDPRIEDERILAWAYAGDRVVVTADADFGTLAVARDQPHRGIVRLPDVPRHVRLRLLAEVLTRHTNDLEKGAIITVSPTRIRVRLP